MPHWFTMDSDDPLVRLANERERLAAAQIALGEAAEGLQAPSGSDRMALREAAGQARAAARAAAEVSARVHAAAGTPAA